MSTATSKRRRRNWPAFPALVRGDDGGQHVRSFATAAAANLAACANPSLDFQPTPATEAWKHAGSPTELAEKLGGITSAATITRLCKTHSLPCRDDGAGTKLPRYKLPIRAIVASVQARGLRATIAAHRAGQLIA